MAIVRRVSVRRVRRPPFRVLRASLNVERRTSNARTKNVARLAWLRPQSSLSSRRCCSRLSSTGQDRARSPAARRAGPPESVRLYVFDCGTLERADMGRYRLKNEEVADDQDVRGMFPGRASEGHVDVGRRRRPGRGLEAHGRSARAAGRAPRLPGAGGHHGQAAERATGGSRLFARRHHARRALALSLGSHRQRERIRRLDVAGAAGRARRDVLSRSRRP